MNDLYPNLFGNFPYRKFSDIFATEEDFAADWLEAPFSSQPINNIPDNYLSLIYYLLLSRYANSTIKSYDENQFKLKVFSIIFNYGPSWIKKLDIQDKLRNLTEEEMLTGSKVINNQALNPGTEPTTEELAAINSQNTSKRKKSLIEGYSSLLGLLKDDVSSQFIDRFKDLFMDVVLPPDALWYITNKGDN